MTDQNDFTSHIGVTLTFLVDFGDKGAGCINDRQITIFSFADNHLGHAMCAENSDRTIGNFIKLFNKDSALVAERLNNELVMHDLVADIDRRPIDFESFLNDINGPLDAGAKTARLGQNNSQGRHVGHRNSSG